MDTNEPKLNTTQTPTTITQHSQDRSPKPQLLSFSRRTHSNPLPFQHSPPRWTLVHHDDWAGSTKISDLTDLVIIPLEIFTRAERATPSMPS
ncbi:hypothetical protein T02_2984 [Trichinella nativa]|uniref:Uncharacterized protein n=1 Tax=Trichinella nativa TaxID=6335 RepID=A0A0V1KZ88_9BILA|nr:hypothetical protein T02_10921 [Trichinella nativa]KRZ56178.1 hypothetical protein T02_11724 [Trichinella nativa]KRZ56508.1 hypothetical protein T02_2984 [Trichinella nativa]